MASRALARSATSSTPSLFALPLRCLAAPQKTASLLLPTQRPQQSPSQPQRRHASILGALSDTKGAYSKRIRRGRGPASGKGKTSGRGHKGQKQHGKVPAGFNGGQATDEKVSGERGAPNNFALDLAKVNLDKLQAWIDAGRIDATRPITIREMHRSRLTHGIKDGVKLLARRADRLKTPIHITVSQASAAAIKAVEAAGGTVQARYYTRPSIRRILAGLTHPTISLLSRPPLSAQPPATDPAAIAASETTIDQIEALASDPSAVPTAALEALRAAMRQYKYRLPDPASRRQLEYYRDPAHRGYLSYQVKEGESPSLFFKSPGSSADLVAAAAPADPFAKTSKTAGKAGKAGKGKASQENPRLW